MTNPNMGSPEFVAKTQQARKENRDKKVAWAEENMKLEWLDLPRWKEMASKVKVRLPAWYEPMNVSKMRRAVKKITGYKQSSQWEKEQGLNIKQFAERNKYSPLFVFYGIVLESLE